MDFSHDTAKTALRIAQRLIDKGYLAYFAGGCVRDHLMRKQPMDFDIATSAHPEVVEKLFPKTIPVGKQFGVILVVEQDKHFEVATFRKEGGYHDGRHPTEISYTVPEEDAKRRDFTVNSLFFDPSKDQIIDYVGGQADLERKIIRAIGNAGERFEEDKLRLLRAIRFASSLGFQIEAETWKAICDHAAWITQVSPERIREELVKILTRPNPQVGFKMLSDSGLLRAILPEIEAMKGVQQQPEFHPEGDVFVHTCLLLEKLKDPSAILALSCLFHDVAKPVTFATKEDGRITFYEHAPIGAAMTRKIMKRLRFSNDEIDAVSECVSNHMKFADVQRMRSGKLKLFISRPGFETELEMHRIDCQASHGMLDNYHFVQDKLRQYAAEELKPKPFINGDDLLALGMIPGPKIKVVLDEMYLFQLEDKLKSREEALEWAKQKIAEI